MVESSSQPFECNEGRHLLLFDGVCALCSWMVQFVLAADRRRVFRFASLQSATGRAAVRRVGGDPDALNTLYVIADYRQPGPKLLTVEGTFEGHKIQARLSRDETQFLLTARGFHWINEFPFSR